MTNSDKIYTDDPHYKLEQLRLEYLMKLTKLRDSYEPKFLEQLKEIKNSYES